MYPPPKFPNPAQNIRLHFKAATTVSTVYRIPLGSFFRLEFNLQNYSAMTLDQNNNSVHTPLLKKKIMHIHEFFKDQ